MGEHIRFAILMIAGLVAAMTIGKYVPHVAWLTQRYTTSLGAIGFIVSGVMIPGAVFGSLLGRGVDRIGAKKASLYGLGLHALASLAAGFAGNYWELLAVRMVEGLGYCFLIVAATVLILQNASPRNQTMALSFWSAFAPVGFALGQWTSSHIHGSDRLMAIGQWHAGLLILLLVLVFFSIPADEKAGAPQSGADTLAALKHPPAFKTALAFGLVTGVLLASVALTPLVLAELYRIPIQEIAGLTALAAIPGLLGRFASGILLGYGAIPRNVVAGAGVVGALAITICLQVPMPLIAALVLFMIFQISVGAIPASLSAMIPHVARSSAEIGTVSGLINQLVNLGNLFSPPLMLAVFALAGAGVANGLLLAGLAFGIFVVFGVAAFSTSKRVA